MRTFCNSCAPSPPSRSVFHFPKRFLCRAVCICVRFVQFAAWSLALSFYSVDWAQSAHVLQDMLVHAGSSEGWLAFLARFLFSFRAGLWLFDSCLGFHSPLCPPDGCTLGVPQCSLSGLSPFPSVSFLHALPEERTPMQKNMSRAIVTHDVPVSKFISSSSHRNSGTHLWRFLSLHSVCSPIPRQPRSALLQMSR